MIKCTLTGLGIGIGGGRGTRKDKIFLWTKTIGNIGSTISWASAPLGPASAAMISKSSRPKIIVGTIEMSAAAVDIF